MRHQMSNPKDFESFEMGPLEGILRKILLISCARSLHITSITTNLTKQCSGDVCAHDDPHDCHVGIVHRLTAKPVAYYDVSL